MAPQTCGHQLVARLAQIGKAIEEHLATIGNEVRQRAVVHDLQDGGLLGSDIGQSRSEGLLSCRRRYACNTIPHLEEEASSIGIDRLSRRAYRSGEPIGPDYLAVAFPYLEQCPSRFLNRSGNSAPAIERARFAGAVHEHHPGYARSSHGHEEALVRASQAFHSDEPVAIESLSPTLHHGTAGHHGDASIRLRRLEEGPTQHVIGGMMSLEGARRTRRGAGAAAYAPIRFHRQAVIDDGKRPRRASLRAPAAARITIPHHNAAMRVYRYIGASNSIEHPEYVFKRSHYKAFPRHVASWPQPTLSIPLREFHGNRRAGGTCRETA